MYHNNYLVFNTLQLDRDTQMIFIGRRLKTKEDVKRTIFQAEIPVSSYTITMMIILHDVLL